MTEKYLMTKEDIAAEIGIPKSTLNRYIKEGLWPKPFKFTDNEKSCSKTVWRRKDVYSFLDSKAESLEVV